MQIDLFYTAVTKCRPYATVSQKDYDEASKRFILSYNKYGMGRDVNRHWISCGGGPHLQYFGDGKDGGAFWHVANSTNADLMICCAAHTYFWREGAIARMIEVFNKYGPGLYGAMASYEVKPHIRTSFFAIPPALLRQYPHPPIVYTDANAMETGLAAWVEYKNLPVMMVTWDGEYYRPDWRKPANIFRRGDQSNCLVKDRHTDIYDAASPEDKAKLESAADGK